MAIAEILESCPRDRAFSVSGSPFRHTCRFSAPASSSEIARALQERRRHADLIELWSISRDTELFTDVDYGQWGLHILSPEASIARSERETAERPADFSHDDLVIGEFIGDQDLLILDRDGRVLISDPIYDRGLWPRVAATLRDFLAAYVAAEGDKYWERTKS